LRSELEARDESHLLPLHHGFFDLDPPAKVQPGPATKSWAPCCHSNRVVCLGTCVCCACRHQVQLLHRVCEWQLEDIDKFRERMTAADLVDDESWVRRGP